MWVASSCGWPTRSWRDTRHPPHPTHSSRPLHVGAHIMWVPSTKLAQHAASTPRNPQFAPTSCGWPAHVGAQHEVGATRGIHPTQPTVRAHFMWVPTSCGWPARSWRNTRHPPHPTRSSRPLHVGGQLMWVPNTKLTQHAASTPPNPQFAPNSCGWPTHVGGQHEVGATRGIHPTQPAVRAHFMWVANSCGCPA